MRAFWLPKAGNTAEEYEDACAPRALYKAKGLELTGPCLRFAVADGATETSFADLWAQILTRAYARGGLRFGHLEEDLVRLQAQWRRLSTHKPLPWYAEEKRRLGAFSSLLGLTLLGRGPRRGALRVLAVGDSCLFQVRDETLTLQCPVEASSGFTDRPLLLSSLPERNGSVFKALCIRKGHWQSRDRFFLMTDALACWFMRECEKGRRPWRCLSNLEAGQGLRGFSRWIGGLRRDGLIKNDDVTLLRITVA